MSGMNFKTIGTPSSSGTAVSAAQISQGPTIAPVARIKLYNADEWEAFTEEWAYYSLKKTYQEVVRFSGAGDKGVDVAGFTDAKGLTASGTAANASITALHSRQALQNLKLPR